MSDHFEECKRTKTCPDPADQASLVRLQQVLAQVDLYSQATVLDSMPCGFSITIDPACREITHNLASAKFFRVAPGANFSLTGCQTPLMTIWQDGRKLSPEELPMQRAVSHGEITDSQELEFVWVDGVRKSALVSAAPMCDPQGQVIGALAMITDLSAQKLLEQQRILEEAERSRRKVAEILESINDAFLSLDADFNILYANGAAARIYRRSPEELKGVNLANISPLFSQSEFKRQFTVALMLRQPVHFEAFGNISHRWMAVHAYPTADGLSVFFRDITNRRNNLAAASRLTAIVESSDAAIIYLNLQNGIEAWNPGAERMFGYKQVEAQHQPVTLICPGDELPRLAELMQRITDGDKVQDYETVCKRQDGSLFEVSLIASPVKNVRDELVGKSLIINDISERRRLEKEYLRLDRLNLAAQLAAGIGHEIRNPMTTVRGFLQFLSMKPQFLAEQEFFQLMIDELDRANAIISEFLSLAKGKPVDRKLRSLAEIVRQLVPLIQADATLGGHELSLALADVPNLLLEEKDMRQLLMNLVRNGLEAMVKPGRLTIRTVQTNDQVRLEVSDQGPGIPPEHLDKVYVPFFTTKDTGTGLGLSVCYRIADQHGARIEITSGDQGTTFALVFPTQND